MKIKNKGTRKISFGWDACYDQLVEKLIRLLKEEVLMKSIKDENSYTESVIQLMLLEDTSDIYNFFTESNYWEQVLVNYLMEELTEVDFEGFRRKIINISIVVSIS